MENAAHTLVGLALARSVSAGRRGSVTAACVVGANLPDVDLLWSLTPRAYWTLHRGWTHGLAGSLALALALAAGLSWLARRRPGDPAPPHPAALAAASLAGVGSHVLLDLSNPYGIRPWLPFDGRWVYGDHWAVVDPWLWWILGLGLYLGGADAPRRRRRWRWGAAAATLLVLSAPARYVHPGVRVAWIAALGATLAWLALGRFAPSGTRRARAARMALAGVVAYAAITAASHAWMRRTADPARGPGPGPAGAAPVEPLDWALLPRAGDLAHRDLLVRTERGIWARTVGPGSGGSPDGRWRFWPTERDRPEVRRVLATPDGEALAAFARFLYATVETRPDGSRVVVIGDARFSRHRGDRFAVLRVPVADAPSGGSGEASDPPPGARPAPPSAPGPRGPAAGRNRAP